MRSLITLVAISMMFATTGQAQGVPSYVPASGLKAWYAFTGNTNDISGAALNLTNYGATLTADRFGASNSAYSFDGFGNHMARSNYPIIAISEFSASIWFKPGTTFSGMGLFYKGSLTTSTNNLAYFMEYPSPNLNGGCFSNMGVEAYYIYTGGLGTGWQNYTITFSNPTLRVYLNGNQIGTSSSAGIVNDLATEPLYVGSRYYNAPDQFFNGKIDDIGIWNRTLTPCEVKNVYNSCVRSVVADQAIAPGGTATFSFTNTCFSAVGLTYQWQGDFGTGYANLSNAGQYSGVTTKTLSVASVTTANNNAHFRCVVSNGICSDMTNVAVLTLATTGATEINKLASISLYPNPNKGNFTLAYNMPSAGAIFNVKDITGRIAYCHTVSSDKGSENLEISSLDNGIYIWEMSNSNGLLEVGKLVIAR